MHCPLLYTKTVQLHVVVQDVYKRQIQEEAKALASSMHMAYIKRGKLSIPALFNAYPCDFIVVLSGNGLTIHFPDNQQHSFHLSMAQLRILRLQRGEGDHLINAVQTILNTNKITAVSYTHLDVYKRQGGTC